jgi:hypothetical protein
MGTTSGCSSRCAILGARAMPPRAHLGRRGAAEIFRALTVHSRYGFSTRTRADDLLVSSWFPQWLRGLQRLMHISLRRVAQRDPQGVAATVLAPRPVTGR